MFVGGCACAYVAGLVRRRVDRLTWGQCSMRHTEFWCLLDREGAMGCRRITWHLMHITGKNKRNKGKRAAWCLPLTYPIRWPQDACCGPHRW